jgi:hypothetical protein
MRTTRENTQNFSGETERASTATATSTQKRISFAKDNELTEIRVYNTHLKPTLISPKAKLFLKKTGLTVAAFVIGVLIGALIGEGSTLALFALTDIIGLTYASLAISLLSAICLALTFSNKTLFKWVNQPLYYSDPSFSLKFIQQILPSGLIGALSTSTFFAFTTLYIALLLSLSEAIYLGPSLVGHILSVALAGTVIIAAAAAIIGSVFYIKTNAPSIAAQCKRFLSIADTTAAPKGVVLSPARSPDLDTHGAEVLTRFNDVCAAANTAYSASPTAATD